MSFSFLIVLPKDSRSGGRAVAEAQPDLGRARDIEIRAPLRQHRDDLRRRVRLDRVIHAGDRQIAGQQVVGFGDHVEIDDEARRLGGILGQKAGDLVVHVSGHLLRIAAERERYRPARPVSPPDGGANRPRRRKARNRGRSESRDGSALRAARRGVSLSSDCLDRMTRPPRPRRRVPRNTASGQGATALLGIATISTSLSGPAPSRQRAGRTAKKDALRRCITTMGHRHVRVRQRADRYAHCAPMQGEMYRSDAGRVSAPAVGSGARRRLFAPGTRVPLPRDRAKGEGYLRTASRIAWAGVAEWQTRQTKICCP